MTASPDFDEWVERARQVDIVDAARVRGAKLKRSGHEHVGPCPVCGGDDRFSIDPGKRVFNCRGAGGGDIIDMVKHIEAVDFSAAVESLTGDPPPRGAGVELDPERARERRDERRDREIAAAAAQKVVRERKLSECEVLWNACEPIGGTHADAYLRRRRLMLAKELTANLRFCASLSYFGYGDPADQEGGELGRYPAMVAAIRNIGGDLIGVHRTYLDADQPQKLVPPGDRKRNKAKKVLGEQKHGAIWLGPLTAAAAVGEGIETTLSWYSLGVGPEEITPVAAVNLGNLAGGATATLPHPKRANRHIPNGTPDPEKPGMLLPEEIREVVILGDGDSDEPTTRAYLLTAARRFRSLGRGVSIAMAPAGSDFNDVLLSSAGDAS